MITLACATSLEARAARREARGMNVIQTGIACSRVSGSALGEAVISCGLAGGVRTELPQGTVLVPQAVRRPTGEMLHCDPELVERLCAAARSFGQEPVRAPLYCSAVIVTGNRRVELAAEGYAGVDMESGLIVAPRVAVVRVILDTPQSELSSEWARPAIALLKPKHWGEALWLMRDAPRLAAIAARVIATAALEG